jgi:hypothetical protein
MRGPAAHEQCIIYLEDVTAKPLKVHVLPLCTEKGMTVWEERNWGCRTREVPVTPKRKRTESEDVLDEIGRLYRKLNPEHRTALRTSLHRNREPPTAWASPPAVGSSILQLISDSEDEEPKALTGQGALAPPGPTQNEAQAALDHRAQGPSIHTTGRYAKRSKKRPVNVLFSACLG